MREDDLAPHLRETAEEERARYIPRVGDKVWAPYLRGPVDAVVREMRVEADGRIYARCEQEDGADWRWYTIESLSPRKG